MNRCRVELTEDDIVKIERARCEASAVLFLLGTALVKYNSGLLSEPGEDQRNGIDWLAESLSENLALSLKPVLDSLPAQETQTTEGGEA